VKLRTAKKLLLILTGGCLVLLILNWLSFRLDRGWHRRSDRIAELRKTIAEGKMTLGREDTIRERWDRMSTNALSSTPPWRNASSLMLLTTGCAPAASRKAPSSRS